MIGKTISHYRIIEKIGKGGMGEVYLAEDVRLGRKVALKFLASDLARDRESLVRFRNEAKAAAELSHPNIATIYDIGEADGKSYLVLEYLEGQTLRERVAQGPLPVEDVLRIGKAVAAGLADAHSHGIVHRDIKSANVMLTAKGEVKILDFGLAHRGDATQFTRPGTTLGTISYMSPEQVRGEVADERSDIWSLGLVLYECLTGRLPFTGESPAIVEQIKTSEPTPPTAVRTGIPMDLERIVQRCTQKRRKLRYQHANDLIAELSLVEMIGDRETSRTSVPGAPRRLPHDSIGMWIVIVVLLAMVSGFLGWRAGWFRGQRITAGITRLAILPFRNLGLEEDQFFVDGMRDEIVNRLSAIDGLGIISQTSASGLHVEERTFRDLARELDSEFVMVASVFTDHSQPGAEQVRVTPRVVRAEDDLQMWSESFTAALVPGSIFSVQARIAERVAESMDIRLEPGDRERIHREPTLDADAYDNYLLGRYYWNRRNPDALRRAAQYFENAIERDPEFVQAYAGLADTYALYPFYGIADRSNQESFDRAETMARRALELDPELAEAHASLAFARMYGQWNWDEADRSFRRALELSPDYVVGHYWYTELLMCVGDYEAALEHARRAVELEPGLPIARHIYGMALMVAKRFDEAITQANRSLELEPGFVFPHFTKCLIALAQDDIDGWQREIVRAGAQKRIAEITASGLRGDLETRRGVELLIEAEAASHKEFPAVERGTGFMMLGELDEAMKGFERAARERDPTVIMVPVWGDIAPPYARLRTHPRYPALLEMLGLERRM